MNSISIVGRIVTDLKMYSVEKEDKKVTLCRFMVATRKPYKNSEGKYDSDYIPCQIWLRKVESFNFKKFDRISILGRMDTSRFTDKDGKVVYNTVCLVESFEYIEDKNKVAEKPSDIDELREIIMDDEIEELGMDMSVFKIAGY